jgi:anti-sigma factor RsiW
MDCNEARALVTAYVDGEVGIGDARAIEAHLLTCAACQEERDSQSALKRAVATHAVYARASAPLSAGIAAALVAESSAPHASVVPGSSRSAAAANHQQPVAQGNAAVRGGKIWSRAPGLVAAAMAASMAAIVWTSGVYLSTPSADERLTSELVASHVRSLISGRSADVASSDQHTVKPWFDGKIDYAPPVHDLASEGFPLVGGRADYVDHRKVATLVYARRLHTIDVYVWPEARSGASGTRRATEDGYHVLGWHHGGMQFWAVSDTEASELDTLRATLDKQL